MQPATDSSHTVFSALSIQRRCATCRSRGRRERATAANRHGRARTVRFFPKGQSHEGCAAGACVRSTAASAAIFLPRTTAASRLANSALMASSSFFSSSPVLRGGVSPASNKCSTSLVMAINALAKRSCSTKLSSSERLSRTAASSSTWRDASRRSFSNGCRAQSAVSEVFTFGSFRFCQGGAACFSRSPNSGA